MDIIDENKYNEFRNILLGCKHINDAMYFADLYVKKNPETKKLVMAMFNGKRYYPANKDFKMMQKLIEKCNDCIYHDEVMDIVNDNFHAKENNTVQYRTLIRIAKNKAQNDDIFKQCNNSNYNSSYNYSRKPKPSLITKYCPHCSKPYTGTIGTTHVICGYNNSTKGDDWFGCRKDWCFTCGKMLCKSWFENKLFYEPNRIHNAECCKKHSQINKKIYQFDYCQCNNKYVNRGL